MSLAGDIAAFVAKLDAAIDTAMQGPVLHGAKDEIQKSAFQHVYNAYQPLFFSRRYTGGGIADKENLKHDYRDKTLTIRNETGWQQLYGGREPGERLVDALAAGSSRYYFHRAGPRSFMPEAEQAFGPKFESLLGGALRAAGFRVY